MCFGLECFGKSVTHFNNRIKLTKNLMHQGFFVTLAFLSLTIKLWGIFAILKVTKKPSFIILFVNKVTGLQKRKKTLETSGKIIENIFVSVLS